MLPPVPRPALFALLLLAGGSAAAPPPTTALTLHREVPGGPGVRAALSAVPAGVRTGLLVLDVASGEVLEEQHSADAFIPASTMKLVTAGAVLASRGGARGWWSTELTVPAGAVGTGETPTLTLRGSGDPTLRASDAPYSLAALARQAHAHGLRTVGRVRVADGGFDPRSWAGAPLGVPMTALRLAEWHGAPPRSAEAARAALGAALTAQLRAAGIRVESEVVEGASPSAPEQGVASVRSASPVAVLAETLRPSDNLRAEELLGTLAGLPGGGGTLAGALSQERAWLRRAGVDQTGVVLADGSGLSRDNRLTPRALAGLLRAAYALPAATGAPGLPDALYRARRNALAEALPQAGTGEASPDHDGRGGTLALRLRGAGLDVRAKTGTLPGVSALAGYVTARSGRVLAFAVLMNGSQSAPILAMRAAQDRLVRAVAAAH